MKRLLLAGVLALSGLGAAPSASADCEPLKECCVYTHDGGWCAPVVEPVCICPYDGCWCIPG